MTLLRRHPYFIAVALLVAAFTLCMIVAPGGGQLTGDISRVGTLLIAVAAGIACLIRAAVRPGRMRWAWLGIGFGALSYGIGESIVTWIETVQRQAVPFPSAADAAYLGMVPLTAAGLLMVPVGHQSTANRVRGVVDGLMITASLLLVSWIFVVHPLLHAARGSSPALSVRLAYPVGDVVLVAVVLFMLARLRRGGRDSVPLMLIGAAMVLIGLSGSLYAYVTLTGAYRPGSLLDAGWFAGFALVLLASRRPERPSAPGPAAEADERQPFAILVPYAAVLGALF